MPCFPPVPVFLPPWWKPGAVRDPPQSPVWGLAAIRSGNSPISLLSSASSYLPVNLLLPSEISPVLPAGFLSYRELVKFKFWKNCCQPAPRQHHLIQINPGTPWSPVVQCWNRTMRWRTSSINTFSRLLFHLRNPRGRHTLEAVWDISKHWHGNVESPALYKLCSQRALTLHQTRRKKRPHFKTDNHTSWILARGQKKRRWRQNYFIIVFFADSNNSSWSNSRDLDLQWESRISQCS